MYLPLTQQDRRPRAGFTLVELMVVIGIILVLMSLLIAGVMKAGTLGKRTTNMNDIQQLNSAIVNFMNQFNVKHIPSRIYLSEDLTQYSSATATAMYNGVSVTVPAQLRVDSQAYLTRLFPKMFQGGGPVDWNGNGNTTTDPGVILEGDQCLVFFLGGIPAPASSGTPGVTGFSTNPKNPAWHVANNGTVIAPFYEFQPGRLKDRTGNGFYSYLDTYGKLPYLYFSNYGNLNGYNPYYSQTFTPTGGGSAMTSTSDCNAAGVFPYAEATQTSGTNFRYVKANGFQILSAGEDTQFGPGSNPTSSPILFWTDGGFRWSAASTALVPDQANDDQANFSGVRLGDAGT